MFISSIAAVSILFAYVNLNEQMSPSERDQTGISTLTDEQRAALENWIQKHCNLQCNQKKTTPKNLSISVNLMGGRQLQLSDGSVYEINPKDHAISSSWLFPVKVDLEESGNVEYPIRIVDINTGTSVEARKAS